MQMIIIMVKGSMLALIVRGTMLAVIVREVQSVEYACTHCEGVRLAEYACTHCEGAVSRVCLHSL